MVTGGDRRPAVDLGLGGRGERRVEPRRRRRREEFVQIEVGLGVSAAHRLGWVVGSAGRENSVQMGCDKLSETALELGSLM